MNAIGIREDEVLVILQSSVLPQNAAISRFFTAAGIARSEVKNSERAGSRRCARQSGIANAADHAAAHDDMGLQPLHDDGEERRIVVVELGNQPADVAAMLAQAFVLEEGALERIGQLSRPSGHRAKPA